MTENLFVDTWGWLTLNDSRETHHKAATIAYRNSLKGGSLIYSTDYVLDETYTLLFKRLTTPQAQQSMHAIFNAFTNDKRFRLIWLNEKRFKQAQTLRYQYLDKPKISFTDLTSIAVMQELRIQKVLTEDAHFEHVGLGFQRIP